MSDGGLVGDGYAGGADPLTILLALLSAPAAPLGVTPGAVATFLLVASTPVAAMVAWVPTRSLTSSLRVRFLLSLAWALAPALLVSATHGVLAGVLAWALTNALAKTGALDRFASGRGARELV